MAWSRIGKVYIMGVKEYHLIIYRSNSQYFGRITQNGDIVTDEYLSADKLKRAKKKMLTVFLKFYDTTL